MTTLQATNSATKNKDALVFLVDFDKKKLTDKVISLQASHQHLGLWLKDPLLKTEFETRARGWVQEAIYALTWGESECKRKEFRLEAIHEALIKPPYHENLTLMEVFHKGLRKNRAPAQILQLAGIEPVSPEEISESLEQFMDWRQGLGQQRLSPLYQSLITVYYLSLIQPLGAVQTALSFVLLYHALVDLGFGPVADYIFKFYADNKEILADTLASCFHARKKKFHQQPWFQFFIEAWDWALGQLSDEVQDYCLQACYQARAQELLESKELNERQYQLIMFLKQDQELRDRKSLQRCLWYRTLYKDLTKRTQERDLSLLTSLGFTRYLILSQV